MKVFILTDITYLHPIINIYININFSIENNSFNWCTLNEENLFKLLQGCEDFRISNRTTQRRQEWPPNLHPWESATLSDLVLSGKHFFFSLLIFTQNKGMLKYRVQKWFASQTLWILIWFFVSLQFHEIFSNSNENPSR